MKRCQDSEEAIGEDQVVDLVGEQFIGVQTCHLKTHLHLSTNG